MTTLVVGGPVCQRDWILPKWFDHVNAALAQADLTAEFLFLVPSWDRDTQEVIRGCKPTAEIIESKEPQRTDQRIWNLYRYEAMVELRNTVLERVREIGPDRFWSLDSDLLPRADALIRMIEGLGSFDAVGGRTWMTPAGTQCPSYAMLRGDPRSHSVDDALVGRIDQEAGCLPVHVIMATKLMTPSAYEVDYELNKQGEDVGWCKAVLRAGLHLGWQASAVHKHVMSPDQIDRIDPRLGW